MRSLARFLLPLAVWGLPAAAQVGEAPRIAPILTTEDARDPWTFAEPLQARVTHTSLDLALDFERHEVTGTATLDLWVAAGADKVMLDSNELRIARVTDERGAPLAFTLGEPVAGKGAALAVALVPSPTDTTRRLVIAYSAAGTEALQWLTPEQTAGKQHPYLFSQGESILNRSWIPLQDSPGIRQTWDARITAPQPLTVVMSGLPSSAVEDLGERRAFRFVMDKPVAPYLIALAAGDLVHRDLGPRTGVWTEPAMADAAVYELADNERTVATVEALFGPYRWGRYDVIVLPPAFPYGGMENPNLTFLTPSFITGDRSNVSLVTHELAHSWSGNLVTHATWADFWLNEGFTSYIESRVSEQLNGEKQARQAFALSYKSMADRIAQLGAGSPRTALHSLSMAGPEDYVNEIAYQKGALFLRTVERTVGRERFDAWLRHWFDAHAFEPATSSVMLADMRQFLVAGDAALEARLKLDEWVYGTGLPANAVRPDPAAFAAVDGAIAAYATAGTIPVAAWARWDGNERARFLRELPERRSAAELAALDAELGLSQQASKSLLAAWLKLALANRYEVALPVSDAFMGKVGRWSYLRPLFQALWDQGEWGRTTARRLYAAHHGSWHPATRTKILQVMPGHTPA